MDKVLSGEQSIWGAMCIMQNPQRIRTNEPHGSSGKEPACQCRRHETLVRSLGREDPLDEDMAAHSSILAWRIPWTGEPGGLQSTGSPRIRTEVDLAHMQHCKELGRVLMGVERKRHLCLQHRSFYKIYCEMHFCLHHATVCLERQNRDSDQRWECFFFSL